jgi:predicted NACHT family NTPase
MVKFLRASVEGLKKAVIAFNTKGQTLEYLAESASCTNQAIVKFFIRDGVHPRSLDGICVTLGLQRQEIVDSKENLQQSIPDIALDALVRDVRNKVSTSIRNRCGTVPMLETMQPIAIDSIYTSIDISEDISRNQRRSIEDLLDGCEGEDFDRFMLGIVPQRSQRIPALEAVECHGRLMILGKPGVGKTIFLQWLAVRCNEGEVYEDSAKQTLRERVPFFITLKEFAETKGQPSLQDFMIQQLTQCGVEHGEKVGSMLLESGRSLLLLDGLDQVPAPDYARITDTIRHTAEQFDRNQFVITCRTGSQESYLKGFTQVEMVDLNDQQISDFADKWFQPKNSVKSKELLRELKANPGLYELAANPRLLTFLCLAFEESGRFPADRSKLYQKALEIEIARQ